MGVPPGVNDRAGSGVPTFAIRGGPRCSCAALLELDAGLEQAVRPAWALARHDLEPLAVEAGVMDEERFDRVRRCGLRPASFFTVRWMWAWVTTEKKRSLRSHGCFAIFWRTSSTPIMRAVTTVPGGTAWSRNSSTSSGSPCSPRGEGTKPKSYGNDRPSPSTATFDPLARGPGAHCHLARRSDQRNWPPCCCSRVASTPLPSTSAIATSPRPMARQALIVLLVWIYYSAQIFLLGAEFLRSLSRRFSSRA
jgi:hypothetical protein